MADPCGAAVSSGSTSVWMVGLHILLVPLHPEFASKTRVRDAGAGLLCMQTKAIKEGWQGHFGDKARIQNDLDKLDEIHPKY